jgi:hypothetical protein
MDKDNDGKISKDECTGPAPLFDRLDRNTNGFISNDEFPGAGPGAAPSTSRPRSLGRASLGPGYFAQAPRMTRSTR